MIKKEKNIMIFVCIVVVVAILHTVIIFSINLDKVENGSMTDVQKIVYLTTVIEMYAHYTMVYLFLLVTAFLSVLFGKNTLPD